MTQLDVTRPDGSTFTLTNTLDIAQEAHQYYGSLLDPSWREPSDVNDERMVRDLIREEHDLWMYDFGITNDMIIECADACPWSKTTGRDMLATEHWQTLFHTHTHTQAATHMAWIFNQRLMNLRLHDDRTSTHDHDTLPTATMDPNAPAELAPAVRHTAATATDQPFRRDHAASATTTPAENGARQHDTLGPPPIRHDPRSDGDATDAPTTRP